MQFITTGIIAEMLTRIFYQDRPRVALVDEATTAHDGQAGWQNNTPQAQPPTLDVPDSTDLPDLAQA
jgi:hypothetical protein